MATGTRKRKLTWQVDRSRKAGGRWTRVYRGKRFSYSDVSGKSDRLGYQRACDSFEEFKLKLDTEAEASKPNKAQYDEAISLRSEMLEWLWYEHQELLSDSDSRLHDRLTKEIAKLQSDLRKVNPPPLNDVANPEINPDALWIFPLVGMFRSEAEVWCERLQALRTHKRWSSAAAPELTIKGQAQRYLDLQRRRAESGQIKPTTYKPIVERLQHFISFVSETDASKISDQTCSGYYDHLLSKIQSGEFREQYAAHLLTAAKQFINWLFDESVLDQLPRKMRKLTIKVSPSEIETFTLAEIDQLTAAASERTKLFLLLALNCGMYPADISDLRQAEIDWKRGRIKRKRTKTEKQKNTPVVDYRLWNETFRLLKQFRSTDPILALTSENGGPLYRRWIKPDGGATTTNNITIVYRRLTKRLKIKQPKPFMLLRKTAATKLEEHESFGRFSQYFLGHAPQSLAERRYAKPSPEQFDNALSWLGDQFGFQTARN